jgi:hypothetical protein
MCSWNNSVFLTQLSAYKISPALLNTGLDRILITGHLKIHLNKDFPAVSRCLKWSLTFEIPDQNSAITTQLILVSFPDFITTKVKKKINITNYLASYVSFFNFRVTSPS